MMYNKTNITAKKSSSAHAAALLNIFPWLPRVKNIQVSLRFHLLQNFFCSLKLQAWLHLPASALAPPPPTGVGCSLHSKGSSLAQPGALPLPPPISGCFVPLFHFLQSCYHFLKLPDLLTCLWIFTT